MAFGREIFWHVKGIWIFYLLAIVCVGVFVYGCLAHIRLWRRISLKPSISQTKTAIKAVILDAFLGRRIIKGDIPAGIMHTLIFWGFLLLFTGTVLLAIHEYLYTFLRGNLYLVFSFLMEIGGGILFTGIIWAIVRRYIQRIQRLQWTLEDAIVPLWLILVVVSGFLLEGLRLSYQRPPWSDWSFIGYGFGLFISPDISKDIYPYLWWAHAVLSLTFIAGIPFTKLFHLISSPVSIFLRKSSENNAIDFENPSEFNLTESVFFDACMRCGRCVEVCPCTGAGEQFTPRDFIQAVRRKLWMENSSHGDIRFLYNRLENNIKDKLWFCTTCRACLEVCPVYGATFDVVIKKRIEAVEDGTNIPKLLNQTLEKLFKYDNPWESSKKKRGAWADGLDLIDISRSNDHVDICYFVGCTTSFDDTAVEIARSFSRILKVAGVNFGILGKKEPCCGDIARRVGELGLSFEQKEKCIERFEKNNIKDVVTSSPHCFNAFKNDYENTEFRARHYTLFLYELLNQGKLKFKNKVNAKVTYHDPCYLSRYNRIFNEPRRIIESIPGITLIEMKHNRENTLCCGGGGGRMWQEIVGDVKMSGIRIKEADETGAEILITACPLCRIMLEDARKGEELKNIRQVMDINELIFKSIDEN